jgi:hypothetical protein
MIFTLLASLLGFASSFLPKLLDVWERNKESKSDRAHELAIMDRQMGQIARGHTQRLEEIAVQGRVDNSLALYKHDSSLKGSLWVENLRASVRPVITYAFFVLFAAIKVYPGMWLTWDANTQVLFAAVVSFWFGDRAVSKMR